MRPVNNLLPIWSVRTISRLCPSCGLGRPHRDRIVEGKRTAGVHTKLKGLTTASRSAVVARAWGECCVLQTVPRWTYPSVTCCTPTSCPSHGRLCVSIANERSDNARVGCGCEACSASHPFRKGLGCQQYIPLCISVYLPHPTDLVEAGQVKCNLDLLGTESCDGPGQPTNTPSSSSDAHPSDDSCCCFPLERIAVESWPLLTEEQDVPEVMRSSCRCCYRPTHSTM